MEKTKNSYLTIDQNKMKQSQLSRWENIYKKLQSLRNNIYKKKV
jgi:hypothetical protein